MKSLTVKKKPQPVNTFWDNAKFPVAVAHRGGDAAGIEKENSLVAFKSAYDLGYRWFETDVVPTKDGVLLAIHGRGLQRQANPDLPTRLKIQSMTYAEAKRNIKIGGEPILTLEKLMNEFPNVRIFIDPKTYKSAPILANFLIARPKDLNRVCIGSFHGRNTELIRKRLKSSLGADITCAAIGKFRGLILVLSASFRLFEPILRQYTSLRSIKTFYLPYHKLLGKKGQKIVRFAHKNGITIAAYTPNEKEQIEELIINKVDVIMSDNARLLNTIINNQR